MMRVITGSARGRRLETLPGEDVTRPTTESVKEALFSMIQFDIEGRRVLDLFAGTGSFFKIGACPCLLKRKDKVEVLETKRTAGGMNLSEKKVPFYRKKMESEDLLVMFSDGVLDCMPQNKLETLKHFLEEMDVVRPQAVADQLFDKITNMEGYEKKDDITILVLGIWDRY